MRKETLPLNLGSTISATASRVSRFLRLFYRTPCAVVKELRQVAQERQVVQEGFANILDEKS